MHPYVVDQMVQERWDELSRLSRADRDVRAVRRRSIVPGWRRAAGRAVAALAVAVAVPRSRRDVAHRQVADLLGCEPSG